MARLYGASPLEGRAAQAPGGSSGGGGEADEWRQDKTSRCPVSGGENDNVFAARTETQTSAKIRFQSSALQEEKRSIGKCN